MTEERIFSKIKELTKKGFVVSFSYENYLKLDSMLIEFRQGNRKMKQLLYDAKIIQSEEFCIEYILYLLDEMEKKFDE